METLEPLINLLTLLTILSVAAERITNVLKLRRDNLRTRQADYAAERLRERGITTGSLLVGVLLAILVKANIFEILANMDSPWHSLGWITVSAHHWVRANATTGFGPFLYALAGCVLTGVALGFGSKFWHDILGTVYEMRNLARKYNAASPKPDAATTTPQPERGNAG